MKFESCCRLPQKALKAALALELTNHGYAAAKRRGFVYAAGTDPVLLVAHMDTVHEDPPETICYSKDGRFAMSPQGIGGDDRAGVWIVMDVVRAGIRPHVLFCEDEEIGGIGAREFAGSGIAPDVNCILEIDRKGDSDAVFYDCDNPRFTGFILGFGFREEQGSFSDISIVAPQAGIAAANLSAGYYFPHTRHEYVDLRAMRESSAKVRRIVRAATERLVYMAGYPRFYSY